MFRFHSRDYLCLLATCFVGTAVHANDAEQRSLIEGPVNARIIRVIDGDTVLVAAHPWPQQTMEVYVRLRGIDAPELKARCAAARHAGQEAFSALVALAGVGTAIRLMHISGDKYFGRVLADITLPDGRNPAQELLYGGYVHPYDGGTKSRSCS